MNGTYKDILVVDDDLVLSEIIADVLETEGHTARIAFNGREALERIRERRPQLILLDLMMPVMNGWEFADELGSKPEWANIPIIVVTAAHDWHNKQQEINAKAVIHKPFDIDKLIEMVQAYAS